MRLSMHGILFIVLAAIAGCGGSSITELEDESVKAASSHSTPAPAKAWWHDSLIAMSQDADLVLTGQVLSQKSYAARVNWLPRAVIGTTVTVKVDKVLKGTSAETLQVETIGGCLEGVCLDKSHEATFETGERALLFLTNGNGNKFIIAHGESGKICLDGRYIRRNPESVEIPENELLAVISRAAEFENAVRP